MSETSLAQGDTSVPIVVTIRIEKEYSVKLPRNLFRFETERGEYNIKTDSVIQKWYDIEVDLKNTSREPISIWLMNCSWEDNFTVNNNYVSIRGTNCDRNFPELEQFKPNESKIYKTTLAKSVKFENPCDNCIYGPQVETTKLGLIVIDDVYKPKLKPFLGYDLAMEDKSVWKIVWSNSLFLLNKAESSSY